MPRVLINALLHGTEAPLLCWKMASRKLRWQLLRQPPLPFHMLDKVGQKEFAAKHGARVARTLWQGGRRDVGAWLQSSAAPASFCLKPARGFQNKNTFVVQEGTEVLRRCPWDAATAARQVEDDDAFEEYIAEELVHDALGATLPMDYKAGRATAHLSVPARPL